MASKRAASSRSRPVAWPRTPPFKRGEQVAIILGAGATKACDGPLTTEILPLAFGATRGEHLSDLSEFLHDLFGVPKEIRRRLATDYPPLPTLLSLLDTAISREHDLGKAWTTANLRKVRRQTEYAVFRAIAWSMRAPKSWSNKCHEHLIHRVQASTGVTPTLISLNYDLRVDYALIEANSGGLPDYGCDIRTTGYRESPKSGRLFKIHGSMHWLYCPTCHRLDLGLDQHGRLRKSGLALAWTLAAPDFGRNFSQKGILCPDCETCFRTVMITPTSLKDYRNPHIASLWYQAERALRECDRVVFVGYSLPWDDVDVIYLLKRGIVGAAGANITVVEHSAKGPVAIEDHDAGQRYQAIFGRGLDWQPLGFVEWVRRLR